MTTRNKTWDDIHAKFYLFGYQKFIWEQGEPADWHIGFFGFSDSEANPEFRLAIGCNDGDYDFFVKLFFVKLGYYRDEDTGKIRWCVQKF